MPATPLIPLLLLAVAFSLATVLEPRTPTSQTPQSGQAGLLRVLMGDGRRLFASHFFAKADAYFHSGAYPSIFDQPEQGQPGKLSGELTRGEVHFEGDGHDHDHEGHAGAEKAQAHAAHDDHDDHDEDHEHAAKYTGKSLDWLARFGQHFYPSVHTHLDTGGADGAEADQVRELLPWLRLAAELDPNRVESYTVAAFWLRKMKRGREAEDFLREGWKANPKSPAILFELGRIYDEDRRDAGRARNLWEHAMRSWREQEAGKPEPDTFVMAQIAAHLARLEEREGNRDRAVSWLETLKAASPTPDEVQKRIDELRKP